jgi:hypothetical protein
MSNKKCIRNKNRDKSIIKYVFRFWKVNITYKKIVLIVKGRSILIDKYKKIKNSTDKLLIIKKNS